MNEIQKIYHDCNKYGHKLNYKLTYFKLMNSTTVYEFEEVWEYKNSNIIFYGEYDGYSLNIIKFKFLEGK